jgi:uncharacterized membrane protein
MWLLLLIGIGSIFYIFSRLFRRVRDKEIKILSLIIVISALAGIISISIRFVIFYNASASLRAGALDMGITVTGATFIVLFMIFFIRQRISKRSQNSV